LALLLSSILSIACQPYKSHCDIFDFLVTKLAVEDVTFITFYCHTVFMLQGPFAPARCAYLAHDGCHHPGCDAKPSYWKRRRVCEQCYHSCIFVLREKIRNGSIERFDERFPHGKVRNLPARDLRDIVLLKYPGVGSKGIQKTLFLLMYLNRVTRATYSYWIGKEGPFSRDLASELRSDVRATLLDRASNTIRVDPAGRPVKKHIFSLSQDRWREVKKILRNLSPEEREQLDAMAYIYCNMNSDERTELSEEVYCSKFRDNTTLDKFITTSKLTQESRELMNASYRNLQAAGDIKILTAVNSPLTVNVDAYQLIVNSIRKEVSYIMQLMGRIDGIQNKQEIEALLVEIMKEPHPDLNWLKEKIRKMIPWLSHLTTLAMNLHALRRLVGIE